MSQMQCLCGVVISDAQFPSKTEGRLIPQEHYVQFWDRFENDVREFLVAIRLNRRSEWLAEFHPDCDQNLGDAQIITEILADSFLDRSLSVAECSSCGRLYVQVSPGENSYRSYRPDDGRSAGVLRNI